ncbi:FGGY-family carbohydrate kinase [Ohessyouella blattaphilus]|uniref:FGGY-family carbohydrate kinase n=1 Tax=Ohessyouella blattaphilus TaxID=2949333 RepID=A0ABT1EGG0_9FIRM|nr:FGGY-family carbohydrate kinase [Ohessyouella blattaphilus]MCP1109784.1 FGGY-family carbohydrate kinase [Ohessyouella blattaphilus]MCR8563178.1 FGGY-family carbohydrate kinase [Ohessyouella blattaphilus]
MSEKYIIGIDEGSQSAKILIFDTKGRVVCEGKEALRPYNLPKVGHVEHPDDDWWTAICVAGKKCMENFKGDVKDIIGIGLCTIRYCRAYLKADGTLAQPALSWMDVRVAQPYEHTNEDVKYIVASSGYITHRLTGERKDTVANYEGMWPIDIDNWKWSEDKTVYEATGMPREMLFDLVMPGDVLGYVTKEASMATGLPEGLPVVATSNDKAVEGLGSGCVGETTACVSLGTYTAAMMEGKENLKDTKAVWPKFSCIPNKYLYDSNGIRRGMWMISWFKDILGEGYEIVAKNKGLSPEEYLSDEAEAVPVGSDGLMMVLDWLAPVDAQYKKGIMIGFDGRHTRGHMYRSLLEAVAMTMKRHVDDMTDELGVELERIIITGGGSNSDLFMQIFADVFGISAVRNEVNGAAGLGSAICVAVACNVYKDFDEAIANMVRIKDSFTPNAENVAMYGRIREVYDDITGYTDPLLKRMHEIFE